MVLQTAVSTSLDGGITKRQSAYIADTPKQIAQQNWKFVEQLLKETKGMLVRSVLSFCFKAFLLLIMLFCVTWLYTNDAEV